MKGVGSLSGCMGVFIWVSESVCCESSREVQLKITELAGLL